MKSLKEECLVVECFSRKGGLGSNFCLNPGNNENKTTITPQKNNIELPEHEHLEEMGIGNHHFSGFRSVFGGVYWVHLHLV